MGHLQRGSLPSHWLSGLDWEESPCLLCGNPRPKEPVVESTDHAPGGSGLWFAVVQCDDCGLCFTNPRPTVDSIGRFYPQSYSPHLKTDCHQTSMLGRLMARLTGNYRKYLPLRGRGRLLDFGCGGGSYLQRMQEQGWQVTGVDTSASTVEKVRRELDVQAFCGSLPHADLRPASFDVITMWQSLEHVHEPLDVLRAANDLLAPGGRLIVAVPNISSLAFRWFGTMWFGLDLPRHLTHFTPATLRSMLARAGFRTRRVQMARHSSWIRASVRQARLHAANQGRQRLLQSRLLGRLVGLLASVRGNADSMVAVAEKSDSTPADVKAS